MNFIREATLKVDIRKGDFSGYEEPPIYISGLRVSFSITKSLAWSTNTAVIKIWNLNQKTRNRIKDFGDQITLSTGYARGNKSEVIYIGDTTAITHLYEPPEIVTILECGDGEKFANQKRVSLSFAANVSARQIIVQIAQEIGLPIYEFAPTDDIVYRQGSKFIGMAKDAIDVICGKLGLQASIQNGGLQIIPQTGTIVQTPFIINQATGMQGVPTRFTYKRLDLWRTVAGATSPELSPLAPQVPYSQPTGYRINNQLLPLILPGSPIILTSNHLGVVDAAFRVDNVKHEGDTYGFLWSTNLEVTQVVA